MISFYEFLDSKICSEMFEYSIFKVIRCHSAYTGLIQSKWNKVALRVFLIEWKLVQLVTQMLSTWKWYNVTFQEISHYEFILKSFLFLLHFPSRIFFISDALENNIFEFFNEYFKDFIEFNIFFLVDSIAQFQLKWWMV